ncbi:Lig chan domain containing protein [Asbolus verrucosus]|uniref:Lig chan domain containing protein n=1 Tax=Asbolus verrucosus TaxID=1661398 RepID=A0A482VBV7_ASBVE|nr:Lig chan domain containing protein [Asbolus verrucosus]
MGQGKLRLNPTGPIHQSNAVSCLQAVATSNFHYVNLNHRKSHQVDVQLLTVLTTANMTSPGYEIQDKLIKKLNDLMKFSAEIIEDGRIEFGVEMRTSFCLFVVDSIENFNRKLEILGGLSSHNPNALFLVYYSSCKKFCKRKASAMLEKLWGMYITNAAVLIPKTAEHLILYSMEFSFKPSHHCLDASAVVVLDHCVDGTFRTKRKYYEGKLEKNFGNCTMDVVANAIIPFVISEDEGFEISLIKQIGGSLNIDFNVTLTGEDTWGVKDEEGYWSNGLGRVYNDSCLGVGNFYFVADYAKDFDFTSSHFVSNLVWIVPIAQYVPKWRVLTVIFSWRLWVVCFGFVVLCALAFKMGALSKSECSFYKKFGNDFLVAFQVVITSVTNRQPNSDWIRIVFVSLSIFGIIISSVYTSSLINYLTRPQRELQVNSIEDVIIKDYEIGGLPIYEDIFNVTEDENSMRIYEMYQVNDSLSGWLTKVADDRDTCTIGTDFVIKYMIAQKDPILTDNHQKPKVHIIEKKIFSYSVVIVASKGFPFLNRINRVVSSMTTFGLVDEMARKYLHTLKKVEAVNADGSFVQELSLHHLQGAFTILVLGCILGVGGFLAEVAVWFAKTKLTQKKRKIQVSKA